MRQRTAFRSCHLCEAACGLELTIRDDVVVGVKGDALDVESQGYLCPKGASVGAIDADPDRLQRPMVRRDGELVEVSWSEAFAEAGRLLKGVAERHGREALSVYIGNPTAHNHAYGHYSAELMKAMGTRQVYSSSTMDAMPQQVAAALMFGHPLAMPLADLDRTDFLLVIGGNPAVSHGSLGHASDYARRIRSVRERGGRVVVVDPIRTRTAEAAGEHVPVRPGTDAHLVASLLQVVTSEGLVALRHLDGQVNGLDELTAAVALYPPERTAARTGVDAQVVRQLARDFAAASPAVAFGRLGTTLSETGTLTNVLINALNVVTGNLDRPGGGMFTTPATGSPLLRPAPGQAVQLGRYRSRVSQRPEVLGEMSVACLAEEILTPGDGQLRGMLTLAGNLARSLPNSGEIERALSTLEALVCVDPYLNQTTRHAHVILPPPPSLSRSHYDLYLYAIGVRNVANFSEPTLPVPDGMLEEWQILLELVAHLSDEGSPYAGCSPEEIDQSLAERRAAKVALELGLDPQDVLAQLQDCGPDRMLDIRLRTGPYGDQFGLRPGGLSLELLRSTPHGVDFGPLVPQLDTVLRTPSGRIELLPVELRGDVERLAETVDDVPDEDELLLVGRRHLRSKNSWLHNVPQLVRGRDRSAVWLHPDDAARQGLSDEDVAEISSRVGTVLAQVRVTDQVMRGVCSIPHGWGNGGDGTRLAVASQHPGTNVNVLTDERRLDLLSGTIAANGVRVRIKKSEAAQARTPQRAR
jgi:anaerobic selenocysteine-containing dehydrogenase